MHVHIPYYSATKRNVEKNNITNKRLQYFSFFGPLSWLLQSNVVRTTTKYSPARSAWIKKHFIELDNDNEKTCLTIDCNGVNKNGPGRYGTKANNPDKQV